MLQICTAVAEFARIKGVAVPTYQYVCNQCEELTEAVQGFHDEPLTECPKCKGVLRKIFSTAGVVFKGSGFYKTDSRGSTSSD
jgi:putative FmdB family regulatory protein